MARYGFIVFVLCHDGHGTHQSGVGVTGRTIISDWIVTSGSDVVDQLILLGIMLEQPIALMPGRVMYNITTNLNTE